MRADEVSIAGRIVCRDNVRIARIARRSWVDAINAGPDDELKAEDVLT